MNGCVIIVFKIMQLKIFFFKKLIEIVLHYYIESTVLLS